MRFVWAELLNWFRLVVFILFYFALVYGDGDLASVWFYELPYFSLCLGRYLVSFAWYGD